MRLYILFNISLILILNGHSGSGPVWMQRGIETTITSTPAATLPTREPTRTELTQKTSTSPVIDIGSILSNLIATLLATMIIAGAGWLTRRFWMQLIFHKQQTPLKNRHKRKDIEQYLQHEREKILEVLAPGSIDLLVKDIVGSQTLFIPPPWRVFHGTTPPEELIEYLTGMLFSGQRVLLLGEPGQGKTIILKQIFVIMVDYFLKNSKNPVPFYISLREFIYSTEDPLNLLWNTYLRNRFPLSFEDFTYLVKNNSVVFLYDGFDEIRGELTQRSINDRASCNVFSYTSLLSCRRHFYDLYLSTSTIQELYSVKIELQLLALSRTVKQYIAAFYTMKQKKAHSGMIMPPEKIFEKIQNNEELQDLVKRPLMLVMVLDIFTDPEEIRENEWNMTKLYQKYTEKWLQNEAAKPDSVLRRDEKATIIQEIAWSMHRKTAANPYGLYQTATFTRDELTEIVKRFFESYQEKNIKYFQLIDDICFRTFLIATEGINYYFIHKSFQEYYVAKYIYSAIRMMGHQLDYVTRALQEVIPREVSAFLKELLQTKDLAAHDREQIENVLIQVYQINSAQNEQAAIVRQYASYYLTVLNTQKAIQFLMHVYPQEPNQWVKRGIMVGLALNCHRADMLERYIDLVNADPDAASINIGYHLVHYGDQALEEGYFDKGHKNCFGATRAILNHLKNENYKGYQALDLLTLRMLLETRGIAILRSNEEDLPFLRDFLSRDHKGQGRVFQREKRQLQKAITSAMKNPAQQKNETHEHKDVHLRTK